MKTKSFNFSCMAVSLTMLVLFQAPLQLAIHEPPSLARPFGWAFAPVAAPMAGINVTPSSGLVTNESGGSATFFVSLTDAPSANVTIGLNSSDSSEGIPSPTSLTFTPANWSTAQTVTAVGQDDAVADGTIRYSIITAPAVSLDPAYNRINPANVSAHNIDNDTAGININPTSGLITSEGQGTAVFSVRLTSQPVSNVNLSLSSSDTTEGTISPASLIFTPGNWATSQTVTITGVDDSLIDGDIVYTVVTAPASSTDRNYNGLNPPDVSVTNMDNDEMLNAVDDSYTTDEDKALNIPAPGVLVNDTPSGNVGITAQLESNVSHGALTLHPDGSLEYTPATNYNGLDLFTYRVSNGSFTSNPATVTITVNPVNDQPAAVADHYDTNATYNNPMIVQAPGVLSNDSDPDNGEFLTVALVARTKNGSLTLNSDGSFTYRPNNRFNGLDTFTYLVSDGDLNSNTVEVEIFVDIFPPGPVIWVSPVNEGEIYHVRGEMVSLQVNTDSQDTDIDRVRFYRWDPVKGSYVEIGTISQVPFQTTLDTHLLVLGWNQIFAQAVDIAGNASERRFIWLILENPIALFLPILLR